MKTIEDSSSTVFDISRTGSTFIVKVHYQVRTSIILAKTGYYGVNGRDVFFKLRRI